MVCSAGDDERARIEETLEELHVLGTVLVTAGIGAFCVRVADGEEGHVVLL
jgi:hypothetical protein